MKNELVRWVRPPVIVNPELLRRTRIRPVDTLWVYWPVFALVSGALPALAVGIAWLVLPLTMHGVAEVWVVVSSVACVVLLLLCVDIATAGGSEPIGEPVSRLNYRGRRKLCQYERNRRRAGHRGARRGRLAEIDRAYSHFSVWPSHYEQVISITVLEHVAPGRAQVRRDVRIATDEHGKLLVVEYDGGTPFEDLLEHQTRAEQIAEQLEAKAYAKGVEAREVQRDALMLRR